MPTSTRFAVAVHALTVIASHKGRPVTSEDLAWSIHTSAPVVRALLARLAAAELTRSQLGAGGGTLLARPAKDIRLLDVYLATEERELVATHRTPPRAACPVGARILDVLGPTVARATSAFEAELAAVTIADLAGRIA